MGSESKMAGLGGDCHPRFERVRDLLAANIEAGREIGASLYVNIDGEDVIDLWGGWRERERLTPWTEHTIVNVFSSTKTVTSLAVLMLADRGQIDLYAPVARYWPEFAQNGKERIEVRHLLSHTAGLPAWEPPFSVEDALDFETSTARLAAQAPWWEPGARASYHASTFGHLNAELVRRMTGMSIGRFIAQEIAEPLDADFRLGLSARDMQRAATVYPTDEALRIAKLKSQESADDGLEEERAIAARTRLGNFSSAEPRDLEALFNSPEWRSGIFAGSNGHANARGLGRILSTLSLGGVSRGVSLLSPATIDQIFHEQASGVDPYYMRPIRWGIGYALADERDNSRGPLPFIRPGRKTCFWFGRGGSLALADVERRITVAYAQNLGQAGKGSLNGLYYSAIYDAL